MTRTNLATATAAVLGAMTLFATAAQACISCEYVPEVLHSSAKPANSYTSHRSYTATLKSPSRPSRERIAKSRPAPRKIETASIAPSKPRVKPDAPAKTTAAAEPVKTADTNAETAAAATETTAAKQPNTTTALLMNKAAAIPAVEKPAKPVGCKKYLASVGTTVTVPCK